MDDTWLALRLLLLLAAANIAPIAAKRLVGDRWTWPVDGGLRMPDGRPLLGRSKTWRGVGAALAACTLLAPVLGFDMGMGALVGLGAMVGDMLASFAKRRIGIAPSGRAFGLDQVPESLLPLLAVQHMLQLSLLQIALVTTAFVVLEVPLARLAHRFGLRETPY
jgi:CDP-2,3-bis-(O-geranylgeranyl)-sn-glycerol synthase